jgi:hypothetical protein
MLNGAGIATVSEAHTSVSMVTSDKEGMCCKNGNPTMLNNPTSLLGKSEWCQVMYLPQKFQPQPF